MSCTSSDFDKRVKSCKKILAKLCKRRCIHKIPCVYQYASVEVEQKKKKTTKVQTVKKVTIINLRIRHKPHAHLKTLTNTPAKLQKDSGKIVGGVVFTRYLVSICCKP